MPCTKRDLVRARAMARQVLAKARQHLQGLLLHHIGFGGRAWTTAYRPRLATARFEQPARPIVLPPGCAAEMAVLAGRRRFRS